MNLTHAQIIMLAVAGVPAIVKRSDDGGVVLTDAPENDRARALLDRGAA